VVTAAYAGNTYKTASGIKVRCKDTVVTTLAEIQGMRNWRSSLWRRAPLERLRYPSRFPARGQVLPPKENVPADSSPGHLLKAFNYLTSTVAPRLRARLGLVGVALRPSRHGLGGTVDEVLRVLESQAGECAHSLITWIFFSPPEVKMTS